MSLRISRTACAVGIAAVFTVGALPAAAQQTTDTTRATARDTTARDTTARDTTATGTTRTTVTTPAASLSVTDTTRRVTSTTRIPVRKEAGVSQDTMSATTSTGIVTTDTTMADTTMADTTMADTSMTVTPPADTTTAPDTTMAPIDTSAATTTDTSMTTTTTAVEPVPATSDIMLGRGMFGNGFYIGIAGGGTMPQGDLGDAYGTGFNVTVPIGWQSMTSPLGVRLDLAYNRISGETFESDDGGIELDDGTIWSAMLGLTTQWPVGGTGPSFYLVGGGGVHHLRDFGEVRTSGGQITVENENVTKFGLNGGAGINFPVGAADIFIEGRYVTVFTENENANYIPVVLGVRFF